MAGPLDIDDDMQRMVLRKGEATAKGGHASALARRERPYRHRVRTAVATAVTLARAPRDLLRTRRSCPAPARPTKKLALFRRTVHPGAIRSLS